MLIFRRYAYIHIRKKIPKKVETGAKRVVSSIRYIMCNTDVPTGNTKKHFKAATATSQCIQGTKELVVERRQNVLRVVGSVGIPAGWRARHLGWVSDLAQDGATLCIEPRGKLRPMCMRMYVK